MCFLYRDSTQEQSGCHTVADATCAETSGLNETLHSVGRPLKLPLRDAMRPAIFVCLTRRDRSEEGRHCIQCRPVNSHGRAGVRS